MKPYEPKKASVVREISPDGFHALKFRKRTRTPQYFYLNELAIDALGFYYINYPNTSGKMVYSKNDNNTG